MLGISFVENCLYNGMYCWALYYKYYITLVLLLFCTRKKEKVLRSI